MTKITLCGGGNLTHAIAGELGQNRNNEISVLTRQADKWNDRLSVIYNNGEIKNTHKIYVSDNPKKVIPEADIVIITVPSFAINQVYEKICPFLSQNTWFGTVKGSGEIFWNSKKNNNYKIFSLQRVPYICRIKEYGNSVYLKGYKKGLKVVSSSKKRTEQIAEIFTKLFEVKTSVLNHYLEVVLSNSNPLLHPSRLYSLFHNWDKSHVYKQKIFFYEEWDDFSSEILIKSDEELRKIISSLPIDLSGISSVLDHYDSIDKISLTKKIQSISAFYGIEAPMKQVSNGYIPDFNSRYFTEDISFGLLTIKGIAEIAKVETPIIDKVINWAQKHMKKEFIINGELCGKDLNQTGIPQLYKINTVDQLI